MQQSAQISVLINLYAAELFGALARLLKSEASKGSKIVQKVPIFCAFWVPQSPIGLSSAEIGALCRNLGHATGSFDLIQLL